MAKKGVIAKVAKETVNSQDLARLRPGQWLNDEIINFYGAMIMERADGYSNKENQSTSSNGRGKPLKAWYFTSFFWAKLAKDGYKAGRLAKWTKKVLLRCSFIDLSLTLSSSISSAKILF
jgi:sentrin-specific protease 1